jgi:uncharacterized protein (DUF302 family)
MAYYQQWRVDGDFETVVERVTAELVKEGFGILCDIDVQATFAEKLDLDDYPRYRILGACNPRLAKDGLDAELDLGALLPCNVVVYEDDGEVVVSAVEPATLLSVVDNPALEPIAAEVRTRFSDVLTRVAEAESA